MHIPLSKSSSLSASSFSSYLDRPDSQFRQHFSVLRSTPNLLLVLIYSCLKGRYSTRSEISDVHSIRTKYMVASSDCVPSSCCCLIQSRRQPTSCKSSFYFVILCSCNTGSYPFFSTLPYHPVQLLILNVSTNFQRQGSFKKETMDRTVHHCTALAK